MFATVCIKVKEQPVQSALFPPQGPQALNSGGQGSQYASCLLLLLAQKLLFQISLSQLNGDYAADTYRSVGRPFGSMICIC